MESARFFGEYPFARVEMADGRVPLQVTLEAFNPLIPLDPEARASRLSSSASASGT